MRQSFYILWTLKLQLDLLISVPHVVPLNSMIEAIVCSQNACVYHNESRLISAVFMAN